MIFVAEAHTIRNEQPNPLRGYSLVFKNRENFQGDAETIYIKRNEDFSGNTKLWAVGIQICDMQVFAVYNRPNSYILDDYLWTLTRHDRKVLVWNFNAWQFGNKLFNQSLEFELIVYAPACPAKTHPGNRTQSVLDFVFASFRLRLSSCLLLNEHPAQWIKQPRKLVFIGIQMG